MSLPWSAFDTDYLIGHRVGIGILYSRNALVNTCLPEMGMAECTDMLRSIKRHHNIMSSGGCCCGWGYIAIIIIIIITDNTTIE